MFLGGFFWFGGEVEVGLRGKIFPWSNLSWGKRISMKGAQDFLAFFKKMRKKIQLKVKSNIKT